MSTSLHNETIPTSSPTVAPIVNHEIVGIGSLLFVLIIIITLFSGKLISIFKFHHINESTISITFGIIIGIIITFFPKSSTNLFSFDSEFFFFVLLPPIVFEAGFSLKRKHFFRNMCTILIFAVIGTMISTLIIAFGLYILSYLNIIPLYNDGNPLECLLFGALISAVDPVGTLSVLGKKELNVDPTLYSLIFGESVLNDAVSIVLYKIFSNYSDTNIIISFETHFCVIIGEFFGIFIGSFLIGLIIALFASAILRHVLNLLISEKKWIKKRNDASNNNLNNDSKEIEIELESRNNLQSNIGNELSMDYEISKDESNIIYLDEYRHNESSIFGESVSLEFSIIILFAYLSYNLGEVLSLSGIVSVFSCGICMSHYAFYNLTWISSLSLHHIIVALSKCSENFVYAYLGISTVLSLTPSTNKYKWNVLLIIFTIILCIISRALNIFPLSTLSNLKRKTKITINMKIMIFFSGLRGAIAFALALNINTPHSDLIITTTLSIVILTTIICGCTTKYMLDKLQLNNKKNCDENYYKLNTNKIKKNIDIEMVESPTTTFTFNQKKYYGIHKYWHHFDTNYMQIWFGGSKNPYIRHRNIGIYSNRQQIINKNNNNNSIDEQQSVEMYHIDHK